MEKQPDEKPIKLEVKCSCGQDHVRHITTPELVEELTNSFMKMKLDFLNEVDWLKQRIEELEDELFVLTEFQQQKGV